MNELFPFLYKTVQAKSQDPTPKQMNSSKIEANLGISKNDLKKMFEPFRTINNQNNGESNMMLQS